MVGVTLYLLFCFYRMMIRSNTDHLMCNFLKQTIWTQILVLMIIGQIHQNQVLYTVGFIKKFTFCLNEIKTKR